jgi:hypothetical protein
VRSMAPPVAAKAGAALARRRAAPAVMLLMRASGRSRELP